MPSQTMAVGWLRGLGLASSPSKTLSKSSPKPVDVGRPCCEGDIDKGPGAVEHSVDGPPIATVAGVSGTRSV